MNTGRYYYFMHSITQNPIDMDREQSRVARETWKCPDCNSPKPGTGAIDLLIEGHLRKNSSPLRPVNGPGGLAIARKDFLFLLGEEVIRRNLHIGSVRDESGLKEDWVCFYGKNSILVRRKDRAGYRICMECGRYVYSGQGTKFYLYPEPSRDVKIFAARCGCLIMRSEIIEPELDMMLRLKGKQVIIEKIPVLDVPLDSLPELKSDKVFAEKHLWGTRHGWYWTPQGWKNTLDSEPKNREQLK